MKLPLRWEAQTLAGACAGVLVAGALLTSSAAGAPRAGFDDGKPGPGARWDPGMLLVKLHPGTGARQRAAIFRRAGVRVQDKLPLLDDMWEVQAPRGVKLATAQRKLARHRAVMLTTPDSLVEEEEEEEEAGPTDRAYWPNDPYFWPTLNQGQQCPHPINNQLRFGQWGLWPTNLTHVDGVFGQFHPDIAHRYEPPGGIDALYTPTYSINVMPVWDLLRTLGRLGEGRDGPWSPDEIRRRGIAIVDTGISNNSDVVGQVASVWAVGNEGPAAGPGIDYVRNVYRDSRSRGDVALVQRALAGKAAVRVTDETSSARPLYQLDDIDLPEGQDANGRVTSQPPDGCAGHGTQVASIAAATAGNGVGIAGVSWNAPLVGVRDSVYADDRANGLTTEATIPQAVAKINELAAQYGSTTESEIDKMAVVGAIGTPVVNMSFGWTGRFIKEIQAGGERRLIVENPQLAAALARLLSDDSILGVAGAGNDEQEYGSGPNAVGLRPDTAVGQPEPKAAKLPCGLKLLQIRGVEVDRGFGQQPRYQRFSEVFPTIRWDKINLLCVAANGQKGGFITFSGRGSSVVDLAAPGVGITLATSPAAGGDKAVFANESGTSMAAPAVSGAASLLIAAAPGAPTGTIATALRRGAQRAPAMLGRVRYGRLDVTCALVALATDALRRDLESKWQLPVGPSLLAFVENHRPRCRGLPALVKAQSYGLEKGDAFAEGDVSQGQRFESLAALLGAQNLAADARAASLLWQEQLGGGAAADGRRVLSLQARRWRKPEEVIGPVYDPKLPMTVTCNRKDYQLTGLRWKLKPPNLRGWLYPTDLNAPPERLSLGVALKKPFFYSQLPDSLELTFYALCEYVPDRLG